MSCTHKFFGHPGHLPAESGLIPAWPFETLIIGTFNPEQSWVPNNGANYFYGRSRNYMWNALPLFAGDNKIEKTDPSAQINFLKKHQIGLTDLLIRINDADIHNQLHQKRVASFLDKEIETFGSFTWNTDAIIECIMSGQLKAVYFTRLGNRKLANPGQNSFEHQMRLIESACEKQNIPVFRLHTPSGMGLGAGKPKLNKLIQTWWKENGGRKFPFLSSGFKVEQFTVTY